MPNSSYSPECLSTSLILIIPIVCFLSIGIYDMSPFLDGNWELGTCSSKGQVVRDGTSCGGAYGEMSYTSYIFHPQDTSSPSYNVSAGIVVNERVPSYTFSRMYIPTAMCSESLPRNAKCVAHKVPLRFSHEFEGVAMIQSSVPPAYFSGAILTLFIIGSISLFVFCILFCIPLYEYLRKTDTHYITVISIVVLFISAVVYTCIRVPLPGPSEYRTAKCVYGSDVTSPRGESRYLNVRFQEEGKDGFQNGIACLRTTSFYGALYRRKTTDTAYQSGLFWHEGLPPYSACSSLVSKTEENYFLSRWRSDETKDCYVAKKHDVNIVTDGYAKRHVAYIDRVFITLFVVCALLIIVEITCIRYTLRKKKTTFAAIDFANSFQGRVVQKPFHHV